MCIKGINIRSWIAKQSTLHLLVYITIILLFYFFLLTFSAFFIGKAKYIYIGFLFELISLSSIAYGIVTIVRNEIPMGVFSIKGPIARIGGIVAVLISLIGMWSFLGRLIYWINK